MKGPSRGVSSPAIHHICALALMKSGRTDDDTIQRVEQLWRMESTSAKRQMREQQAQTYRRRQKSCLNRRYEDLCPTRK